MKTIILAIALCFASTAYAADKAPVAKPAATTKDLTKNLPPKAEVKDAADHVANCRDGKEYWSASTEHRGACQKHGGVAEWMDGTPVKGKGTKREYR